MRCFNIYLAGAMACCETFQEMNEWREDMIRDLENAVECCNQYYDADMRLKVINPCNFYDPVNEPRHQSELEVMKFDLARVKESDLVIVNLRKINHSIGTSIELFEAWQKEIPVIALDLDGEYATTHPWVQCCISRVEETWMGVIDYLIDFYFWG